MIPDLIISENHRTTKLYKERTFIATILHNRNEDEPELDFLPVEDMTEATTEVPEDVIIQEEDTDTDSEMIIEEETEETVDETAEEKTEMEVLDEVPEEILEENITE